ncbi:hypothetical protein [Altericista sp. CCNU0014]|uniref:hypothetical protein n=1 Tax=Altericista sp. CCNU0014 TaxID=3082949 RepID=UPI0038500907
MSEYQYYEFQAVDRPLSSADQTYLRGLSSRASVSATRASFGYNYSDFRGDPEKVLDRCFDMMLYIANFGTRQLMFRFPKKLVKPEIFKPYCVEHCISVSTTEKSVILDITMNAEDYYTWIADEGVPLGGLVALREDLLQGDFRALYLAWLRSGFSEDTAADPEEMVEPPIPPNLKKLSPALKELADFFLVDEDLIAAAATESTSAQATSEPVEEWLAALSDAERNHYLLRAINGETHIGAELLLHLRSRYAQKKTPTGTDARRTLAELIEIARNKQKVREQKERQAAEKAERKRLEAIAPKAETLWQEIAQLVELKQAGPYDRAVAHLKDLRDVAVMQGTADAFRNRLRKLKEQYSNRPGLLTRLRNAGLSQ